MKKLSLIGACAVILIFVIGVGTPAAAPVEQGQIEYVCPGRVPLAYLVYDGSTVPEADAVWEVYEASQNATWHSDGEVLFIDAYDSMGTAAFYRVEESLTTAHMFYIQVTANIISYRTKPGYLLPPIFLGFGVSDGAKVALVWTDYPLTDGRVAVNWPDPGIYTSDPGVTDWFQPNTYRLVVDKSHPDPAQHMAHVYVNGTHVLQVPYDDLTDWPGTLPELPETPHLFAFGVNWSDTVWDQVDYAVCGPPYFEVILEFMDNAVGEGTLVGLGPGASAEGRLEALRNMIETAGDLVEANDVAGACQQLHDAYERTDGEPRPPDFVEGEAAEAFADLIQTLVASLGCE